MQYMTTAEIREKYLNFFEEKGCKRMPSSSLIPDDPSLLLTAAGMVQFKPYFLQQKHLEVPYIGTTTVQKCVRTNDIDIIGTTGRHLSFFEMLGNFSFGEYFKKEMCAWALEFSTEVLGLPLDRLYFTVFEDDEETIEIWKELSIDPSHISKLGEEDNFWRAGPTGPCGPCSELYFDQGPEVGCGRPDCAPGCDCDRFLEYWNCVFTQYDAQEDGSLVPLPKKNIDTGMGLERIAAIMQGVDNNYDTDILRDLIAVGEDLSHKTYKMDPAVDLALRIIADHSRAVTFMIADGILPSNEGRGYVLRRLLRRAVMKAHSIGIEGAFLSHYIEKIVELMGHVYPELIENKELVDRIVLSEEERFGTTLKQGQVYLEDALDALDGSILPGDQAFVLHDTYGFPIEVTKEICAERKIGVDETGFEACMDEQRNRARAANMDDSDAAWAGFGGVYAELLEKLGPTQFVGYDLLEATAVVEAIVVDGAVQDTLPAGVEGDVVLNITPFYAEMGGEVGDTGVIFADGMDARVVDTKAPEAGLYVHKVIVDDGVLKLGASVTAAVDAKRRAEIARNHTCTHILHACLREVLGAHVKQAGSYVGPDRLRFDFTHFEAMSPEQIAQVESLANSYIMQAIPTTRYQTSLDEARESGVTALFGEKYGETVRVVEVGQFSRELCGGCHVNNTSEIGFVKITNEGSVGANLRRVEAVTSYGALEYVNGIEADLRAAAQVLNVPLSDVADRAAANLASYKELQTQFKRTRNAVADDNVASLLKNVAQASAGYSVIVSEVDVRDPGMMRNLWDVVRSRMPQPCAAVFIGIKDDRPILLAAGTDEAVAAGFDAGAIIKSIAPYVSGGGGGKPSMAQAGGKDVSGIPQALSCARELLGIA